MLTVAEAKDLLGDRAPTDAAELQAIVDAANRFADVVVAVAEQVVRKKRESGHLHPRLH